MRWKISILLIAAMLCVALTGIAAAGECDVKCAWEPCGTKVTQGDVDAVYSLTIDDKVRIMYGDTNTNYKYDIGETIYVDMTHPVCREGDDQVEEGDVRLSWYHDEYAPNTKVFSLDLDKNNPLRPLPCNEDDGQYVVGFVDIDNDGVFNLCNPVYVDTDCNCRVSAGDVRLTERIVNTKTYDPYTVVAPGDWDISADPNLRDLVTGDLCEIITPFWRMVGYIDSDCSGDWTCPDKLYLQQLCTEPECKCECWEVPIPDCDREEETCPIKCCWCVKDKFVTIGDLRLYVPPEETGWPECGTKVEQCNIDATYVLTKDCKIRIMYGDVDSDEVYDMGETLYVDMTHPECTVGPDRVEAGDIRLNWYHDEYEPNTKVTSLDSDRNNPLQPLPGGQVVVGITDEDYLYVDTDNSSDVTVNDKRLSEVVAMGVVYPAYSDVQDGDFDALLNAELYDPVTGDDEKTTPFWALVGYIDSDCSTDWTCPDKLYLQLLTGGLEDCLVTIHDFRLYIPPEAIAEGWPECGTWVEQCNCDAEYVLTKDYKIRIGYGDVDSDEIYDVGETVYVDMTHPWCTVGPDFIEAGDIRLTWYHDLYEPNTKVTSKDIDKNIKFETFDPCNQTVIGFVDIDSDGVFNLCNPVYVDTDCNGKVSPGDVRLTEVVTEGIAGPVTYLPYTVVESGDWDTIGETILRDLVTGEPELTTPFPELVGYIDSDFSGDWTCPDKLYLQQIVCKPCVCDDGSKTTDLCLCGCFADQVVTIGDLRLYIPPCESTNGEEPIDEMKGDFDGDGDVDFRDFSAFAGVYEKSGGYGPGDFDDDGDVDFRDFSAFAGVYSP